MKLPAARYSVTTHDPSARFWCGHTKTWGRALAHKLTYRYCTHRYFRTRRKALTHAAVLVLRGVVDVFILGPGREWRLSTTVEGDGADVASSTRWARRYLAMPRRKR